MKKHFISIAAAVLLLFTACERKDKAFSLTGHWSRDTGYPSLSLTLKQSGDQIIGSHVVVAANGNRIDSASDDQVSITGDIKDNKAEVYFISGHMGVGTATIEFINSKTIRWTITKSQGEHYFPDKVVLKLRESMPQNTGEQSSTDMANTQPNIFVVGYEKNSRGKSVATLWKNGKPQRLSDGLTDASATSIFVSGGDVYVAGTEGEMMKKRGVLWKNGEKIGESTVGSFSVRATSVFVSGKDVYMTATASNLVELANAAVLWKNNDRPNILASGQSASAHSVFVSDGDVYVAGNQGSINNNVAVLWKNGVPQILSNSGYGAMACADSVYVSGKNVCVTGYVLDAKGRFQGVLWKNGIPKTIGTPKSDGVRAYISGVGDTACVAVADFLNAGTAIYAIAIGDDWDKYQGSLDFYLGSIYMWDDGGQGSLYIAGTENSEGKWYAVVFNAGEKTRLTDGNYSAGASAVFVR